MLSATAYSFRMKSRLAISLSWVAGYTNVIALILCGMVISHATGNVTGVAWHATEGWTGTRSGAASPDPLALAGRFAFVLGCFFAGAVASAIMTETARRRGLKSKYMLPMAVEALLLCGMALAIDYHEFGPDSRTLGAMATGATFFGIAGLGAFAMGLQNATITRVSGAVVRTTHLTGVVTDFGLEGVQFLLWAWDRLRGRWASGRPRRLWRVSQRHPSVLRLALLASIVGSFLFGVVAGTLAWAYAPDYALIAPVGFLLWIIVVDWRKPIADVRELDLLSDPDHRGYGDLRSLLPPELGLYRLTHHRRDAPHHAPDFQQWVDRLPRRWRVVILAVSPLTHFDHEEALDLLAAVQKLRAAGKDLVVCGVNRGQFKVMREAGTADVLGVENFCPDLDMAVARAMNRVQELTGTGLTRELVARS